MNKKLFLVLLGVEVLLLAGTIVGIYTWRNNSFTAQSNDLTNKAATIKSDIEKIKAEKDSQDYSPSDVVKNFLTEFKADSAEKMKLYLATSQQNLDVKKTLAIDKNFSDLNVTDATYTIEGDTATVDLKASWPTEDATFEKTVILTKEDGLWKISEIKGV